MDVGYPFFTHLHRDHISDYGYVVMTTWNCGRRKMLTVFGPAGRGADVLVHEAAFLDEIIEARQMWSHSAPVILGHDGMIIEVAR